MTQEPSEMSNVANIADFRPTGFVPANDATPVESAPTTRAATVGRGLTVVLRALAFALVKTVQVLAFAVLSTLRWPIRVLLGLTIFICLIGLPMVWFGFPEGSQDRTLFTSVTGGGVIGCGLLRHFYDELLIRLDPRGPRISA